MERPSHTNFNTTHPLACRLAVLGLAVSLQLAVLWGLTHGLVGRAFKAIGPMVMVPVAEPEKLQPPPPPDPTLQKIEPLKAVAPDFTTEPDQQDNRIGPTVASRVPLATSDTPAAGPDRAAVAIVSTHTIPPYPMLAQRLGVEGEVTLRLTVLTDGSVGKAEIVNSSGRGDLDDAARQWVVTHWTYRPALDKGQPIASQTLVSVLFKLHN